MATNLRRSPGARALGRSIRRAREASGISLRGLSTALGQTYVAYAGRLERGEILFTPELIEELAAVLRVSSDQRERWLHEVHDLGRSPWTPAADVPEQALTWMSYEQEASAITEVCAYVPGLLQTRETARAIIAADENVSDVEELVSFRAARQDVLWKDEPVTYTAYLDERALRREIGGRSVAARQLGNILDVAAALNVTVRIVPDSVGAYFGMAGPFNFLEFSESDPIVYIEGLRTATWHYNTQETDIYADALRHISTVALSEPESFQCLREHKARLEGEGRDV